MTLTFEKEKNIKAGIITILICGGLLLLFILKQWALPVIPPPPVDLGIEVNLGNSDEGAGTIAPQAVGAPAITNTPSASTPPPPTSTAPITTPVLPNTGAVDPNAPPVNTDKPIKKATPFVAKPIQKPQTKQPNIVSTIPTKPNPKAIFGGGIKNGPGGNNQDNFNDARNQGDGKIKGDKGSLDGTTTSDNYKGGGIGNSPVRISKGLSGRKITQFPSFEDEFNENAKVAVNITVNPSGKVTGASINVLGTTTTNTAIRNIAIKKAYLLVLNPGEIEEQSGTIVFDFRLK